MNPLLEWVRPLIKKRVVIPEVPEQDQDRIQYLKSRGRLLRSAGFDKASNTVQVELTTIENSIRSADLAKSTEQLKESLMEKYIVLELDKYDWKKDRNWPHRNHPHRIRTGLSIRHDRPKTLSIGGEELAVWVVLWMASCICLGIGGMGVPWAMLFSIVVAGAMVVAGKIAYHYTCTDYQALWRMDAREYPYDIPDWVIQKKRELDKHFSSIQILTHMKRTEVFPELINRTGKTEMKFDLRFDPVMIGVGPLSQPLEKPINYNGSYTYYHADGTMRSTPGSPYPDIACVLAIWGEDFEDIEDALRNHAGLTIH